MTRRSFITTGSALVAGIAVAPVAMCERPRMFMRAEQVQFCGRVFRIELGKQYRLGVNGSVTGPDGVRIEPKD
jgi:hypothetical protein